MRRRNWARGTRIKRLSEATLFVRQVPEWREATWRDVERYVDGRDVAATTQRDIVSNLRAFYRWAGREGYCQQDPTALVDTPKVPRRLPRPARSGDIGQALELASPRVAAMVALMAGCGLRCCEVAALTWDDVDLVAGIARVVGKGDRERQVWLSSDVVVRLAALDTVSPGPVFMNAHGRPASRAVVSQTVNALFRDLGLTARAHRLRHWHATDALARSKNLAVVRDMLGHASAATTEGYAAVVAGEAAAVQRTTTLPAA